MGQYICEVNGETAEVELNVLGKHHEWMDGLYMHHTCQDIAESIFVRKGKELIIHLGICSLKKFLKNLGILNLVLVVPKKLVAKMLLHVEI